MILDTSGLHPAFERYYGTRTRISVVTVYYDDDGNEIERWQRYGRVGRSMGTHPVYLLLSRADSDSSSDVLSPDTPTRRTFVVAEKPYGSRNYIPTQGVRP